MWQQFWVQNIHYILEVFFGFFMVTAGWIYLDGWLLERRTKTLIRAGGFFMLAIWSFFDAAPLGIAGAERLFFSTKQMISFAGFVGFGFLFLSLLIDPIPVKPGGKPIRFFSRLWSRSLAILPINLPSLQDIPIPNFPSFSEIREVITQWILAMVPVVLFIALLFSKAEVWIFLFSFFTTTLLWLHYSRGIQSEWKFFYLGFFAFTIALAFASISSIWQGTSNVLVAKLLSPYRFFWILEHVMKFIGAIFLGIWAWGFIRFRIFPQIFSSLVAFSFLIFITVTVIYTGFLLNRTQESIVKNLETNVKTLSFALEKVKESAILAARIASTNPQIREALRSGDKDRLFKNLNTLMFENETDFMIAVNTGGEVVMRAEDKERFGDSLANDPVVWRALDGKAVVTTFTEPGVTIPTVSIKASSPVVDTSLTGEPEIIGVVITGFLLDTAFVDGIKKITDLDITVFANDVSAATTFIVPESQLRLIGNRELDQDILTTVLKKHATYTGTTTILNRPFLAAYIPIKDVEETTIGMFFTGRSHASILAVVSDTMKLTFSISILLMIFFLLPIGWLARFISYNQQV